jgi:hypothetical protein
MIDDFLKKLFFNVELLKNKSLTGISSKGRIDLYDYAPQTSAGDGLEDNPGNPT